MFSAARRSAIAHAKMAIAQHLENATATRDTYGMSKTTFAVQFAWMVAPKTDFVARPANVNAIDNTCLSKTNVNRYVIRPASKVHASVRTPVSVRMAMKRKMHQNVRLCVRSHALTVSVWIQTCASATRDTNNMQLTGCVLYIFCLSLVISY